MQGKLMKGLAATLIILAAAAGFVYVEGVQHTLAIALWSWSDPYFDVQEAYDPVENCGGADVCVSGPMRVLTFNVLCRLCQKPGWQDWDQRLPELRAIIWGYEPDLIGFQELGGRQDLAELLEGRPEFEYIAYEFGPWTYADSALAYDAARFEALDSGQLWLNPHETLPFGFGWRALSMPRYMTWAHMREKETQFEFLFVNTHFDNNGPNKEASAVLANEVFGRIAARMPVLMTGDFNTPLDTERYERLITGGDGLPEFTNTSTLAMQRRFTGPDWQQEDAPGTDYMEESRLIDHIFVGGPVTADVSLWELNRAVYGARNWRPSDHPAVFAEMTLTLREEAAPAPGASSEQAR